VARIIKTGNTIIDYINKLEDYAVLTNEPVRMICLNKAEFIQFMNLYKMDYKSCASMIQEFGPEANHAYYKDIFVYYDGRDVSDTEFDIAYVDNQIRRFERQRDNPAESNRPITGNIPITGTRFVASEGVGIRNSYQDLTPAQWTMDTVPVPSQSADLIHFVYGNGVVNEAGRVTA